MGRINRSIRWIARPMAIACMAIGFLLSCSGQDSFPRSEVREHNGVPTLFINGEPDAGMTYMTYNPQEKHYRQFGEAGVELASLQTTANKNLYWHDPTVWVSRDSFDFSLLDKEMELIIAANPGAWIFPRVYLWSPDWWDKENPEELMVFHHGKAEIPEQFGSSRGWKATNPSWASQKWREDAAFCLTKYIEHVRSRPYGKRVIGYHLASGNTEEWVYWNFASHFADYSKPAIQAFRNWLKEKYGTDEALKKGWNDDSATLETAAVPTFDERTKTELMFFRDPGKSMNVIDYGIFHSELVAETIDYLGKAVKEATGGTQVVGAFYGYNLELMYWAEYGIGNSGHLALGKLLESPNVDFLTSPTSYALRDIGTGHSTFNTELESIRLHGKLWFDENDYRTHLCPADAGFGRTGDLAASESVQLRQLGNELCEGAAAWWFDMGGGWFDEPPFMEIIKRLNSIAEKSVRFDRSSIAEIAVVIDEHSLNYLEESSRFTIHLLSQQRLEIGRIGAPVDYILMDDLGLAKGYKLYIFPDAFHVSPEQRKAIQGLAGRGARAFVWIYAPGFAGETLDVRNIEELTGIKIAYAAEEAAIDVAVNDNGRHALDLGEGDIRYGMDYSGGSVNFTPKPGNVAGPVFFAEDESAETLGTLESNGKPGLVRKNNNGVWTYYSAAPCIAANILRGIAEEAGAHIYTSEGDAFHANKSFISLHTNEGGMRTLRLPKGSGIYDVYNQKEISAGTREAAIELPARHTVLYFLGTGEEWGRR